ncbi:MAG: alpha-L-fucosidase [Clostridia bacterium]|nr:alpha-L-fucosidase [Clostridia bacterium]
MINSYGIVPFGATPSIRQTEHFKKFSKKAFFHFGVNTFSDAEWGDGNEPEKIFAPTQTDVCQWIKTIKDAGFTLAILTVKHHDGFCLWPSEYTQHTIAKSPYKNGCGDILREFTDACRKYGIATGVYISPWDRNSEYWGSAEYNAFFNNQLTEILSEYGKIDEVWFDGAGSAEADYDWALWESTIRKFQPDAVIFGSMSAAPYIECRWVGNESGYAGDPHYPTVDISSVEKEIVLELNSGKLGGDSFLIAEVDTSIRPGWFYHKEQDNFVKSPKQLIDLWFDSVGKSAIMLLNFPPDRRGLIHETDSKNAIEAHRIISRALSENYAEGSKVTASSERCTECGALNIVDPDFESFYAASDNDKRPVIEITLPQKNTFDTVILGEVTELGVRVGGFTVEAEIDGKWQLLADKKSIGFKRALHFSPITTDKVRITFYDFVATPLIREISFHNFTLAGYTHEDTNSQFCGDFDICSNQCAKYEYLDNGILVQLGGLFPYNTIKFCGDGIDEFEILAFNGMQYHSVYKGKNPATEETVHLDKTIFGSYQFKLLTHRKENSDLNIHVYKL